MEWNLRVYDVASVSDVYELTIFTQTLAERAQALKARFAKEYLPVFLDKIKKNGSDVLKWSMYSGVPEEERAKHRHRLSETSKPARLQLDT